MDNLWTELIMESYRNPPEIIMKNYCCSICGRVIGYNDECDRCIN